MLPRELEDNARSALAMTFSVSNIYFWRTSGYFATPAYSIPLLHTWSLAIEEQFYIFLPLFILLVRRLWPSRLRLLLAGTALISFLLSARGAYVSEEATFYLLHTRGWELLMGTLLVVTPTPWIETPLRRSLAAGAGVLLILIPAMTYWEWMAFPGIAALPPCLGAALVIAAGRGGESLAARMLAWRPLAFIGLISYSLYLWHWPILVFLNLAGLTAATRPHVSLIKLSGVALAILLAWLSWRFVEKPFRFGSWRPRRRPLFLMAGTAAAVLALAGWTAIDRRGLPGRFPPQAIAFASYLDYDPSKDGHFRYGTCFVYFLEDVASLPGSPCLSEETGRPNYLLVGDSHAAHFWYGLSRAYPEINFLQATGARCKPEVDADLRADAMCSKLRDYVFSDFLATHKVDRLVLAAAWDPSDLVFVARTLDWAKRKGIEVTLLGPIIQYDDRLPRLLAFAARDGDPGLADRHRLDLQPLDQALRRLAASKGVEYVSFYDTLCQGQSCLQLAGPTIPLQYDSAHLTKEGSLLVARRMRALHRPPDAGSARLALIGGG